MLINDNMHFNIYEQDEFRVQLWVDEGERGSKYLLKRANDSETPFQSGVSLAV